MPEVPEVVVVCLLHHEREHSDLDDNIKRKKEQKKVATSLNRVKIVCTFGLRCWGGGSLSNGIEIDYEY